MADLAMRRREVAREIFLRALAETTVAAAVARGVHCQGNALRIAGRDRDLGRYDEVCIVSIGKAGSTLFDAMDALLPRTLSRRAVISAPAPPQRMSANTQYFCGGHPVPDAASFAAARAAFDAVDLCGPSALVLFLVSGGASAMCELPIAESISLEDVVVLNRLLIGSGASIAEVNCVRKHLSRIKGGQLATRAGNREKVTLLVSDVPRNALDALGSGPSLPDSSTVADCLNVLSRYALLHRLPASIATIVAEGLEETPESDHPAFTNATATLLLDSRTVIQRATLIAQEMGYQVEVDCGCDDWDHKNAADYLLARLKSLRRNQGKICLLSGGEVTVQLPENPGIGGRNLQFCLYCAASPLDAGTTVLSAGTDGIDGNSTAAGAVVDATTSGRGRRLGLDLRSRLEDFDAYNFLAPVGDIIVTGPTGNNLRDIRILLWESGDEN